MNHILANVGLFLNQREQKECSLACHQWYFIFSRHVFAKAVLKTQRQITNYLSQDAALKALTVSLHIMVPVTDYTFSLLVDSCPRVKSLTLFSKGLQVAPAVRLMHSRWADTLTSVRMDTLLLTWIAPLFSSQLVEITGDLGDLPLPTFSLPRLKIFKQDSRDSDPYFLDPINIRDIIQFCRNCPALTDLTIYKMGLYNDDTASPNFQTSNIRSLCLEKCARVSDDTIGRLLRTFRNLEEFSIRNSGALCLMKGVHPAILENSPQLRSLDFEYDYQSELPSEIAFMQSLSPLKALKKVYVEFGCEIDTLTQREKVSFSGLLESLPQARNLTIYGNAHLFTTDGIEHYMIGKVGSYDDFGESLVHVALSHAEYRERFPKGAYRNSQRFYMPYTEREKEGYFSDDSFTDAPDFIPETRFDRFDIRNVDPDLPPSFKVRSVNNRQYKVKLNKKFEVLASQGEILMERGLSVMTTQRKHHFDGYGEPFNNFWDSTLEPNSRLLLPLPLESYTFRSSLTVLKLQKVTLRNPTYRWINACCPLLIELHILETDVYPLCEVYVKDLRYLKLLSLTFDQFYFLMPVIETICDERKLHFIESRMFGPPIYVRERDEHMLIHMNMPEYYKITVNYSNTLNVLKVGNIAQNILAYPDE